MRDKELSFGCRTKDHILFRTNITSTTRSVVTIRCINALKDAGIVQY